MGTVHRIPIHTPDGMVWVTDRDIIDERLEAELERETDYVLRNASRLSIACEEVQLGDDVFALLAPLFARLETMPKQHDNEWITAIRALRNAMYSDARRYAKVLLEDGGDAA